MKTVKSNSLYSLINLNKLSSWQFILSMIIILNSCSLSNKGLKNQRKISKQFSKNSIDGFINIDTLSNLLKIKSLDSNMLFINNLLTYQNVGIRFDSNSNIKDLVGGNYFKKMETKSLAIDFYGLEHPISIATSLNILPEKLNVSYNEILAITSKTPNKKVANYNNTIIFIAPKETDYNYIKFLKKAKWPILIKNNNISVILLIKE